MTKREIARMTACLDVVRYAWKKYPDARKELEVIGRTIASTCK